MNFLLVGLFACWFVGYVAIKPAERGFTSAECGCATLSALSKAHRAEKFLKTVGMLEIVGSIHESTDILNVRNLLI